MTRAFINKELNSLFTKPLLDQPNWPANVLRSKTTSVEWCWFLETLHDPETHESLNGCNSRVGTIKLRVLKTSNINIKRLRTSKSENGRICSKAIKGTER